MNISSPAFRFEQFIPPKYTCDGGNTSPPLMISGVPSATASLALIVDSYDATSGTFTHWLLYNVSPKVTSIPESGVPPECLQGVNSAGHMRYDGPCLPNEVCRCVFRIYALDVMLTLNAGASRHAIEGAMHGHVIAKSDLVGLCKRGG